MSETALAMSAPRVPPEKPQRSAMALHTFKIGDIVTYRSQMGMHDGGTYEVTRLLPADSPEPSYRLKSVGEQYERVAKEYELRALGAGSPQPTGGRDPRPISARKRPKVE